MNNYLKVIYRWGLSKHFTLTRVNPSVFSELQVVRTSYVCELFPFIWTDWCGRHIVELGKNCYVSWYKEGDEIYVPFELIAGATK